MAPILFHCPCLADVSTSEAPPTANEYHHELSNLLFCEDCDAIRCDSCVSFEVSHYLCPSCLFEASSSSARTDQNKCARNCFQCPQCHNSLTVSAGSFDGEGVAQPPFYLSCNFCRWDSKAVGVQFDKSTSLAQQLQKQESTTSPDLLQFANLKDHFTSFLAPVPERPPPLFKPPAIVTNALNSRLERFGTHHGSLFGAASNRGKQSVPAARRDELEEYIRAGISSQESISEKERVRRMREMTDIEQVAPLSKRWENSWSQDSSAANLKPLRTVMLWKQTKRCSTCKHILIKPEAKSLRFKIKVVASNYLPSIELYRRPPPTAGSRLNAIAAGSSGMKRTTRTAIGRSINDASPLPDADPLRPGRSYTYELSFVNPLYEPITVRLAVARPSLNTTIDPNSPPSAAYAVNLPSSSFPIAAFAEDWEYAEDLKKQQRNEEDDSKKERVKFLPGVVESRANQTTVMMEVSIAKETVGPLQASMLVTYTYQSDESEQSERLKTPSQTPIKGGKPAVKSFSFWTLFDLGVVQPRAMPPGTRSAISSASGRRTPSEY